LAVTSIFLSVLSPTLPLRAERGEHSRAAEGESFFIISSVDTKKKQIVLKRPTEVTELIQVTDKTVYLDDNGKTLQFQDLRAGDTVYVSSIRNAEGTRVATRIRIGPMTIEELHRRYLKF
jgi:hypothetical protein